jgi:hypothetical protein
MTMNLSMVCIIFIKKQIYGDVGVLEDFKSNFSIDRRVATPVLVVDSKNACNIAL